MSALQAVLHATRVTTSEDGSYPLIFAPCRQRIRAEIEGKTIADSERAIVLRETGQRRELNVACSYEAPYDSAAHVKDYVAFFPDRMDHWYQDEVLTATEVVDATPLPTNPLATWMIKAAWASASGLGLSLFNPVEARCSSIGPGGSENCRRGEYLLYHLQGIYSWAGLQVSTHPQARISHRRACARQRASDRYCNKSISNHYTLSRLTRSLQDQTMNDELISELKKYVTSDEGRSDHINEVGKELVVAFNTLSDMLVSFGVHPRPKELLQMNNAIGDTLELLETLDPLEKFQNTGVFIRVGLLH